MNKKIGIIITSCDKKSLGVITMINKEICDLTKYEDGSLVRNNITILAPDIIDLKTHNQLIENYFQNKSESSFIGEDRELWMKDRLGFLIPVSLNI